MNCNLFKELGDDKKGSVSFFIVFVYLALILLLLFAVVIPFLVTIDIEFYEAGEDILRRGKEATAQIEDVNVRAQFDASLDAQTDSVITQVEILGFFFQYGWVLIILIITLVLFLATRQTVEIGVR